MTFLFWLFWAVSSKKKDGMFFPVSAALCWKWGFTFCFCCTLFYQSGFGFVTMYLKNPFFESLYPWINTSTQTCKHISQRRRSDMCYNYLLTANKVLYLWCSQSRPQSPSLFVVKKAAKVWGRECDAAGKITTTRRAWVGGSGRGRVRKTERLDLSFLVRVHREAVYIYSLIEYT